MTFYGRPGGYPFALAVRPKDRRFQVAGKNASSYEFYTALALEKYGFEYLFQVEYWGGRRMLGGILLDFLVFTRPFPTPLWVNGEYWHDGQQKSVDYYQQIALAQFGPGLAPAVVFYGEQCSTPEAADRTVRKEFTA